MIIQVMLLGGKGLRFMHENHDLSSKKNESRSSNLPKQFYYLDQKQMVFCQSTILLAKTLKPNAIIFAVDPIFLEHESINQQFELIKKLNIPTYHCFNGETRSLSLLNAIKTIEKKITEPLTDCKLIIHDANRPYLSGEFLQRVKESTIKCNEQNPCYIPTLPVHDSMIMQQENSAIKYVNRENYFKIQTPQIVYWSKLIQCLAKISTKEWASKTDEGSIMTSCNFPIDKYLGDEMNQKITTKADIKK